MLKDKMRKVILLFGIFSLLVFVGCSKKDTTFLITENAVGPLTKSSEVSTIESVFSLDSIVKDTMNSKIGAVSNKIQIFEKGGMPLLVLTPSTDSISSIENVQILDPRYRAENSINLYSTFKDIQDNYTIKKVVTTLNSIVVFGIDCSNGKYR